MSIATRLVVIQPPDCEKSPSAHWKPGIWAAQQIKSSPIYKKKKFTGSKILGLLADLIANRYVCSIAIEHYYTISLDQGFTQFLRPVWDVRPFRRAFPSCNGKGMNCWNGGLRERLSRFAWERAAAGQGAKGGGRLFLFVRSVTFSAFCLGRVG